jgi:hypothetical protein
MARSDCSAPVLRERPTVSSTEICVQGRPGRGAVRKRGRRSWCAAA